MPEPKTLVVDSFVIHFWVVRATHDLAESNVKLVEQSGEVPYYTNSKKVNTDDELCVHKPAKRPAESHIGSVQSLAEASIKGEGKAAEGKAKGKAKGEAKGKAKGKKAKAKCKGR